MAGQLIKRGARIWLARVYVGIDPATGKREYHNKTVHGNKNDAQTELNRMLTDRDKGILAAGAKNSLMSALFDDLLHDYEINGQDIKWARYVVEKNLRPYFESVPISKLTSDHIRRYVELRHKQGRANATINNELALLRRSLSLGMRTTPPKVMRAPRIEKLKVSNVRKGFFEDAEYLALREKLPEELRPILTFGFFTGCRKGEILSLQWSQVDLDIGMVRLEAGTTKNAEARLIPLHGELLETLKMQRAVRDAKYPACPWVFFRNGQRIIEFKNAWTAGCKAAKIEGRLFHDLRRTGVRNLVRAGAPEKVAQAISGHKTRAIFDRYNITTETDLKDAMRRVSEYHERKNEQSRGTPAGTPETGNPHTLSTQTTSGRVQ